jgi:endonuclease III
MVDNSSEVILNVLRKTYGAPKRIFTHEDPFQTLIMTIISQNTSAGNAAKAYAKLSNKFKITPEGLAKVTFDKLKNA